MPPFGHRSTAPVLLDSSIETLPAGDVFAGGGDDRTMLRLTLAELVRVAQPRVISLST